jgi:hypothetical protein
MWTTNDIIVIGKDRLQEMMAKAILAYHDISTNQSAS